MAAANRIYTKVTKISPRVSDEALYVVSSCSFVAIHPLAHTMFALRPFGTIVSSSFTVGATSGILKVRKDRHGQIRMNT